jgi:DNA replication protein DnaC
MRKERSTIPTKPVNPQALKAIGVGRSYLDYEIQDLEELNKDYIKVKEILTKYVQNIHVMYRDRLSLLFYGSNGSGKTMCLSILAKHFYKNHYRVWLGTVAELMTLQFSKQLTEEQQERRMTFNMAEILLIDEIGKETFTNSGSNITLFEEVMRSSESRGRVIILSTNLDLPQLEEQYGNSIFSLIDGNYVKLKMIGQDYRKTKTSSSEAFKLLSRK